MLRFIVLTLSILLASSAFSYAAARTSLDCQARQSAPEPLLESRVVIFGEVHGTREIPSAVVSFVCQKLERGQSVSLVLEISADEQDRINAFLRSNGGPADTERLVAGIFWTRPLVAGKSNQDGRASIAMFELLEAARQMSLKTNRLRVIAGTAYKAGQDPDDMLATAISTSLSSSPTENVVALMGGVHASMEKGTPWNPQFEGVGYRLRELRPVVIHIQHFGGSAWACASEGCRESKLWSDPTVANLPLGFGPPQRSGFNWSLVLGRVTASPPKVSQ
jgi:hypothetical protein